MKIKIAPENKPYDKVNKAEIKVLITKYESDIYVLRKDYEVIEVEIENKSVTGEIEDSKLYSNIIMLT